MNESPSDALPHIEGYDITRRLGRGGMADVYLAIQVSLSRPVAIKVLAAERTAGEETVTRFEQEARTIARLDHPNIVSIFDVGRTGDGRLYYVMPYLPNGDLSTRDLRDDDAGVAAILKSLARALGYAHKLGIVHRDVKPENVLFDKLDRPLLADFGIALASSDFARVTREGSTIGSSGYMSPEQARGLPIDGRADLYSLGVVAYEMLSGDLPYHGPDTLSVALAHVEQPIPRLPLRRRRWQPFIDKAMAKSPEERFQTAEQMEGALDRIALQFGDSTEEAYATKPLPTLGAAAPARRGLSGAVLAAVFGLAGVVMVGYALNKMRRQPDVVAELPAPLPPTATAAAEPPPPSPAPGDAAGDSAKDSPAAAESPLTLSAPLPAAGAAKDADHGGRTAAAGPSAPATPPKPAEPAKPRVTDLQPGTALRDRSGPELSFVPAAYARDGQRYSAGHPFALARFEVTRREYAAFVSATGREPSKCREPHSPLSAFRKLTWRDPGFAQDDSHPVVCVSWGDANAYVQWLASRTHARYRLPTHAEWVHAAHWNASAVADCRQGNLADDKRTHGACKDGFAYTSPVGNFKANLIGIHDLVGNVSQWTLDCKARSRDDGTPCKERMFSGSSWRDDAGRPLDYEDDADDDIGYTTIGFRVLREIDDSSIPTGISTAAAPREGTRTAKQD
jgi:formylglycine-generating enzyme required for sulfatase activity